MNSIKNIWKSLQFDNEIVDNTKPKHINRNLLYTHLISGKISLQEYLTLSKG